MLQDDDAWKDTHREEDLHLGRPIQSPDPPPAHTEDIYYIKIFADFVWNKYPKITFYSKMNHVGSNGLGEEI